MVIATHSPTAFGPNQCFVTDNVLQNKYGHKFFSYEKEILAKGCWTFSFNRWCIFILMTHIHTGSIDPIWFLFALCAHANKNISSISLTISRFYL